MGSAFKGYLEMAKLLLSYKAGANVKNDNDASALIYASVLEKIAIIKLLLENGANKDIKDNRGNTALQHAVMQGNEEAIQSSQ